MMIVDVLDEVKVEQGRFLLSQVAGKIGFNSDKGEQATSSRRSSSGKGSPDDKQNSAVLFQHSEL